MEREQLEKGIIITKMISKLIAFFTRRLKKKVFTFDPHAENIPEAFGYSTDNYKMIVDDLKGYLEVGERLAILDLYLKSKIFEKYHLDLNNPSHAAVLGYAFCTAVVLKREKETKEIADKVLDTFYADAIEKSGNHLVS